MHHDALACFASMGLAVAVTGGNGGMTRVTVFAFALTLDALRQIVQRVV